MILLTKELYICTTILNLTVPCEVCPKGTGIEVFYKTPTREYTHAPEIYGHYQLQNEIVNGRVYFKKGDRARSWFTKKGDQAIWWNGNDKWMVGLDSNKGSDDENTGYFVNDVLCPHQITEWNGKLFHGQGNWKDAGNSLALKCSIRGNFIISIWRLLII